MYSLFYEQETEMRSQKIKDGKCYLKKQLNKVTQ
jgi:hypothetical protein